MERIALVALLKPFVLLVFLFLLVGSRIAVARYMRDGKIKRLLLWRF